MSTEDSSVDRMLKRIEHHQRVRRLLLVLGLLALLVVTGVGLTFIGFTWADLIREFPGFVRSIWDFLPPNFVDFTLYSSEHYSYGQVATLQDFYQPILMSFSNPSTFWTSIVEQEGLVGLSIITIAIGFCGTVLGFPLALVFGVLGSERVTPFPFNFIFRGAMSTIRAIPALVWVLVYIPLTGLGPVGALMAITTDTIGNLGRLFTDELEEIDDGPIEAIGSTGASGSQRVFFGMLSQVFTSFIAWTLYILEINVRIAVSLGVVGAGGIGQYISNRFFGFLEFSRGMAGILMVIVIVLTVEMISSRLRARLRPSEHEQKTFFDHLKDLLDTEKWIGMGGGSDRS